jgi:hypothetical protein
MGALFGADTLKFSASYVSFAVDGRKQKIVFAESQDALYQGVDVPNTLLLMLHSLLVYYSASPACTSCMCALVY